MRHQIPWSDANFLHVVPVLLLLFLTSVVRSGQPISGLPDDGGFDMPESILEPELAQSVWSREGLKNPIRRTTTIPMNDRLDIGNTGELQQKGAVNKPVKRTPRNVGTVVSEYDTLNDDFLTEYDLLNLDFSLDEPQNGKKNAKEVEVPAKEFEWAEGEKGNGPEEEANFPPKEWWDLEEPTEGTPTTASTTKRHALRGAKLFEVEEDERSSGEEKHSLALGDSQKRESGRVRRGAKAEAVGQTHRGIGEWSGEAALEREEVKIWPKLVPIKAKSELRPIHLAVPTTKRPPQTATMVVGKKRISGDGNDDLPKTEESKKEQKKEEIFRDLPSGVEVVSSLVEKTVENRQQSSNTTQQQQKKLIETLGKTIISRGRVEPKKQKRPPQMAHILNRDSPEPKSSASSGRTPTPKSDGKLATKNHLQHNIQSEKKQEDIDRLLDSLPTIIIGEPEKQSADHPPGHQSKIESFLFNQSISDESQNGKQNASTTTTEQQQNGRHKGQIEVAPADQPPQLPHGFVYLATVDTLPKNGRLLIGNRSYVIEKTLLQRHLFPQEQQRQQQEQQKKVVANDGEFSRTDKLEDEQQTTTTRRRRTSSDQQQTTTPRGENGDDQQQQQQEQLLMRTTDGNATARGEGTRRFAPRNKAAAFVVASSQHVPPPPPGTTNDHFGIVENFQSDQKPNSGGPERKTDILARHLGMTLSQIFGNFTLGGFPANSEKKVPTVNEKQQPTKTEPMANDENGNRAEQQTVSEAHRLTRIFQKKGP